MYAGIQVITRRVIREKIVQRRSDRPIYDRQDNEQFIAKTGFFSTSFFLYD